MATDYINRTKDDRIKDFASLWETIGGDDSLIVRNSALMAYLNDGGFFTVPASTKYHGAYEGGLYDHSATVARRLIELTENNGLKWKRNESPFIIGMFHDLCKCDQYIKVPDEEFVVEDAFGREISRRTNSWKYEYNHDTILKGHGAKSIMILSQFISLTEEEMLCIRYHMGAYGNEQDQKAEWSGFDAAIRKTNGLCLWTHCADMIASKLDER